MCGLTIKELNKMKKCLRLSISIFGIMTLKEELIKIFNKKIQKNNESISLYKYTKLPEDIINKILEYNY